MAAYQFFMSPGTRCGVLEVALGALLLVTGYLFVNKREKKRVRVGLDLPAYTTMGMLDFIHTMASKDGPFALLRHVRSLDYYLTRSVYRLPIWLPGHPAVIVVGDAEVAREIWEHKDSKRATMLLKSLEASMGGPNMLTTNGQYWKVRRQGINHAFAKNHIRRIQQVADDKVVKWVRSTLLESSSQTTTLDVGHEMLHLMLTIVSESSFHYTMSEEQRNSYLHNNYLQIDEFFTKSMANPSRLIFGRLVPGRRHAWNASMKNLDLCREIVNEYRRNPPTESKGSMLEFLLQNPAYTTDKELLADVLLVLGAGHDTTAFTLAFALIELAKAPNLQSQLRNELRSIKRKHEEDNDNIPWQESNLLRYCITETMRLFPAFAMGAGSRIVGCDVVIDGKTVIPEGSLAIMSILMMQRDARLFPEPDKFCPERWYDATVAQKRAMVPFACGPQNCVGQPVTNAVLPTLIGRIVCDVEVRLVDEGPIHFAGSIKPVGTRLSFCPV